MADFAVSETESFEYTYSAKQQEEIERIRSKYLPKVETKLEQLIRLDKRTEKPGRMIAIADGIAGSLLLGVGMCCTMVWNTGAGIFVGGILIGLVGMGLIAGAYPIYKKVTEKERAKITDQILALTNEL